MDSARIPGAWRLDRRGEPVRDLRRYLIYPADMYEPGMRLRAPRRSSPARARYRRQRQAARGGRQAVAA